MSDAPEPRFRRIGRMIPVAGFAVAAVYILGTILTSVFLGIYGRPPSLDDGVFGAEDRGYCVRTLVGLRDELEQEVTFVAQPPKPRVDAQARWQAWDASFHDRFNEAQSRCVRDEGFERAYDHLAAMYKGYAGAATRIIEVRATIAPAVADVVELLRDDRDERKD